MPAAGMHSPMTVPSSMLSAANRVAVPLCLYMRDRPAAALFHRQPRLGAVKGLDLALFIHRQHQGLVGGIEVEADDILDLGDEVRIAQEPESFRQMRLEPVRGQTSRTNDGAMPACAAIVRSLQRADPAASRRVSGSRLARFSSPSGAWPGRAGGPSTTRLTPWRRSAAASGAR